jgi:tetratricopeptide (TPR) repeat protein
LLLSLLAWAPQSWAQDAPAAVPQCVEACNEMIAAGELKDTVSQDGCEVRVCHEQARRYYEDFDFIEASESLDQIELKVGHSPSFQIDRGLVNYATNNFEAALGNFDYVLEVYPDSVQASAQRAHTLVRLKRIPEARAQFQKILDSDKADSEYRKLKTRSYVHGNLGVLRLMETDLGGGKKELDKALKIDPRNTLARTFSSQLIPALEAKQLQYEDVFDLVVGFEELSLRRANSGLRQLSAVLSRSPDFRLGYLLAAETQRRYLDFKGCELTLRVAEQRFADDTEIFANRIRCTMLRYGIHSPDSVQSIEELKALAAKDPNDPLVQEMLLLISQ